MVDLAARTLGRPIELRRVTFGDAEGAVERTPRCGLTTVINGSKRARRKTPNVLRRSCRDMARSSIPSCKSSKSRSYRCRARTTSRTFRNRNRTGWKQRSETGDQRSGKRGAPLPIGRAFGRGFFLLEAEIRDRRSERSERSETGDQRQEIREIRDWRSETGDQRSGDQRDQRLEIRDQENDAITPDLLSLVSCLLSLVSCLLSLVSDLCFTQTSPATPRSPRWRDRF
jgi:hypothetical protein